MSSSSRGVGRGRLVIAQLRNDRPRSITMLAAIAVATAAFTVLTGAADTARVVANQKVASTGPSAYDILVRPRGTQTAVERESGEVRPDFLDGVFGGISMQQYRTIRKIPGVDVAAPVAMIGYTLQSTPFPISLGHVAGPATRQLFEVGVSTATDRGLSHIPSPPSYVYVTRRPLVFPPDRGSLKAINGPVTETEPDGRHPPVCGGGQPTYTDPYHASARDNDRCESLATASAHPTASSLYVAVPMLIEAINPAAEARLDGLNDAIVNGRYLRSSDGVGSVAGTIADRHSPTFPVLVSSRNYLDDSFTVVVRRLATSAADAVLKHPLQRTDSASRGTGPIVHEQHVTIGTAYHVLVQQLLGRTDRDFFSPVDGLWRVKPVRYAPAAAGTALGPLRTSNPTSVWRSRFQYDGYVRAPADNEDIAYRQVTEHIAKNSAFSSSSLPAPVAVGVFDPSRIRPFNPLTHVPVGGYEPPQADPADASSKALLHDHSLLPNSNLAGYLGQPPQLITTFSALPALENSLAFTGQLNAGKPISAIRIRVAGANNEGALSRARVNLVAQDIIERTGLQVDITAGSSPSTRVTDLPAGAFGRPPLVLREGWVDKNIAVRILRAVDRKSLLLFILVLVVSGLFVLNAATAAVRSRRRQLGILACTGWSPRQLFATVMSEQAVIGVVAGVVGLAVAIPIAAATRLHVTALRAVLALVAAAVLSVLAAIPPAISASRADPLEAIRPPVSRFRAARPVRTLPGLAMRTLLRGRGRSAIAVIELAIGICSTVFLLAVTTSFNGQLAGDLLGEAVTVQVRGVDFAAVLVMLALGVFGVTDVLYLNVRERGTELATLQATGWSRRQIGRLITFEGTILGFSGSLLGAAVGIASISTFTSETVHDALPIAALAVAIGTALGALAALLPIQTLPRRLATSLAEE
jgi:putative ABC transport system permease protein